MLPHIQRGALPLQYPPPNLLCLFSPWNSKGNITPSSQEISVLGDVTPAAWLPLLLNHRVYQGWKSPRKYSQALKGLSGFVNFHY